MKISFQNRISIPHTPLTFEESKLLSSRSSGEGPLPQAQRPRYKYIQPVLYAATRRSVAGVRAGNTKHCINLECAKSSPAQQKRNTQQKISTSDWCSNGTRGDQSRGET